MAEYRPQRLPWPEQKRRGLGCRTPLPHFLMKKVGLIITSPTCGVILESKNRHYYFKPFVMGVNFSPV